MPHHRKYTTTVVGAHSVPRWYEALDRLVTLGQLSPADFAVAQYRATQAAILEQEIAGIDVITGGEMHRRTHNRHAPPNAMLNHFWQKMPAFQGATRPKYRSVHACQGNYAVGPDYDGQIGHRYFDTGRYKADLICKIDCTLQHGRRGWVSIGAMF